MTQPLRLACIPALVNTAGVLQPADGPAITPGGVRLVLWTGRPVKDGVLDYLFAGPGGRSQLL